MLELTDAILKTVSVHHIGNSTNGEEILLSNAELDMLNDSELSLLNKYFLKPFSNLEYYCFTSTNNDFTLNPLYKFASILFKDESLFHKTTINIATYLYEVSKHPQIKPGDLFIAYFNKISIDNKIVDAIGIFKSENRQSFLKVESKKDFFSLKSDEGINIDKLDKGCIILNTEEENGYKVCVIDNTNRNNDTQYWKDDFLKVRPYNDSFHHTKDFLNLAKNFISKQMPDEFEVTKTAQIDLLNRSLQYFQDEDEFSNEHFTKSVIQDPQVIDSFNEYKKVFEEKNDVELLDAFEISAQAVKKQARVFKSVLKLDKNFHIYIHGDKSLIEQGKDTNGRKFYKIYYDEEL